MIDQKSDLLVKRLYREILLVVKEEEETEVLQSAIVTFGIIISQSKVASEEIETNALPIFMQFILQDSLQETILDQLENIVRVYDFGEKTKSTLVATLKTFIVKQNRDVVLKSFQCLSIVIAQMTPSDEIYRTLIEDVTKIFLNQVDQQILLGAFLLLNVLIEKSGDNFPILFGKFNMDALVK